MILLQHQCDTIALTTGGVFKVSIVPPCHYMCPPDPCPVNPQTDLDIILLRFP